MRYRLILALLLATAVGHSEDTLPAGDKAAMEAPPVGLKVTKGTVREVVKKTGRLVPAESAEIQLDLSVFDPRQGLRLTEVSPNGTFVNKGDVIARLHTKAIDAQLEREKMSLDRAELALRHAEAKQELQGQSDAEQLERAESDAARSAKRLEGYREHEKKFNDESERLTVQARGNRVKDQQAELEQLERMYGEDELVDATEEIVIHRSRRDFARSKASQDLTERRRVYQKKWYYHWREEDHERAARFSAASLARTRRSQAMSRERRSMDLDHQRHNLKRQRERLGDLKRDRAQFVVRAPQGGILLHGAADDVPLSSEHKVGQTVRVRSTLFSVAGDKSYRAALELTESDLLKIKAGTAVQVTPTLLPDRTMVGRLEIEYLPKRGGKFEASVRLAKNEMRLRPGLTANCEIVLAEDLEAVRVLRTFVVERDGKHWVKVGATSAGPFELREVSIGANDGTFTAVRAGLAEGEYVVKP